MENPPSWIIRVLRELRVISDGVDNAPMRLGLIELPLSTLNAVQRKGFLVVANGYVDITRRGWVLLGREPKSTKRREGKYERAMSQGVPPPDVALEIARALDSLDVGEYTTEEVADAADCAIRHAAFWCMFLVRLGELEGAGEKPFTSWSIE